ncbi:MAG TPA: histidinol dehydrogenase, partial [Candidatus Bathyarchaeia archaeon]|nr:histidinol dehydrogenase [Candidatus Bathyarchaeia archaeon]
MKILRASQIELEILKDKAQREVAQAMEKVAPIVDRVKKDGDKALIYYTKKFDKVQLKKTELRVSGEELKKAYSSIRKEELEAIRFAIENVRAFHEAQKPQTLTFERLPGVKLAQVFRPLERVGAYIPGGRASYPSSAVMTVVPAKVAGVKSVIVCSPPNQDGSISAAVLVAAAEAGAEASFKVGGAQAVAAMAYGTETVPKVDKIVGPGNIYVAAAKALVNRDVAIDFLAGPSEILIIADNSADPQIVASDLLAQAEH